MPGVLELSLWIRKRLSDGRNVEYDLGKLEIGGVRADTLSREELFAALSGLAVPGIDPHMGAQAMLEAFAQHLSEVVT
jgi:hypothetical protein